MYRFLVLITVAGMALGFAVDGRADVPAPPVNQDFGFPDALIGELVEADCRVCHASGLPDRHHMLYGQPIPNTTYVPYPDSDGPRLYKITYPKYKKTL